MPLEFAKRAKCKTTETAKFKRWPATNGPFVISEVRSRLDASHYWLAIRVIGPAGEIVLAKCRSRPAGGGSEVRGSKPMSDLADNIAARNRAEHIIDLIGDETPRFWQELARLAGEQLPKVEQPAEVDPLAPMDETEAIKFERQPLDFGKHAGQEIGVVPCGYIGWLAENDFAIRLRRYVKSARFERRQREE